MIFPTEPRYLVLYIEYAFNKGSSPATISSQLSAVSYLHKLANASDPTQAFIIKKMVVGVHKLRPQIDIRLPLNVSHVCNLIKSAQQVASSQYTCVLLKAMYSLAFHALLRVGEFTSSTTSVSPNLLMYHQIELDINNKFLKITFYQYKHSNGHFPIVLKLSCQDNISCPITNMASYFRSRGSTPGPLFCFPGGHPVSNPAFISLFRLSLKIAGLDVNRYKGHSFRIGKATELAQSGVPDQDIQARGRWHSNAFTKYIRIQTDT